MNARSVLCSLIVAALMLITSFSAIECATPDVPAEQPQRAWTMAPPTHNNITIINNAGFLGANSSTGISQGSGTPSDPYIIENWTISSLATNGIYIYNSGMHLIIRNCYLRDNGLYGIRLAGADNVDVINCTIENNDLGGIYADSAFGSSLYNNSIYGNRRDCVRMLGSHGNVISGNNISHADRDGINITGGYDHDIFDNEFFWNSRNGVNITDSYGDNLTNNSFTRNTREGIRIVSTDGNIIDGNNCSNNNYGIYLDSSNNSTISNNTCSHNHDGIFLNNSSNDNDVGGNNCSGNGDSGILLHTSNDNVINGNDCSGNNYGMCLNDTDGNTVNNNTCNGNDALGMFIYAANGSIVFNNSCSGNVGYGIRCAYAENSTIWNNTLLHNNGAGDVFDPTLVQAYDAAGSNNRWYGPDGYGNWWSDWRTPDALPPWGAVDIPYAISGSTGAGDLYPRTGSCPVTSPTVNPVYYTDAADVDLSGTADGFGISSVSWENSVTGDSGTALGVTIWSVNGIALNEGSNPITTSTIDSAGFVYEYKLNVVRDSAAPTCMIQTPTPISTYETESPTFSIGGTAYDSGAVVTVTWKNMATGASGTATGTTAWSVTGITLAEGSNLIYVNVTDGMGRTTSDSVTVTYTPPPPPELDVTGIATPTSGTAPLLVMFGLSSTGGVQPFTFLWDFGDGTNSTKSSPSHLYNSSGTYTVTLTVTDNASQTATWNTTVTVSAGGGGGIDLFNLVLMLLIIGLIAAIAIPAIFGMRRRAKEADSKAGVKDIGTPFAQMMDDTKKVEPSPPKSADNTKINVSESDDGKPKKKEK